MKNIRGKEIQLRSKIVHLELVKNVLTEIINELKKIQKILARCSYPKIKHTTLCKNYFLKEMFFYLSIWKSFYAGNNIFSEILKKLPAFVSISMIQLKYPGR